MPKIRDERTGTDELIRDGNYHYAALLADPDAAPLATQVKKRLDALVQAQAATRSAELVRIEKQALFERAEYLHDHRQSVLELSVLAAVARNRKAAAYQEVYPHGLSALLALSGEAQEAATTGLLQKLKAHHPELWKTHAKDLQKFAQEATAAEKVLRQAQVDEDRAFLDEQAARAELSRQLHRDEGELISLYPGERGTIRLYYRQQKKRPTRPAAPAPAPA